MKESNILKKIMIAVSGKTKIFRNNTGQAWAGKSVRVSESGPIYCQPGDVLIRNARPLRAGLCKGSSDLIGWTPIEITPDMVGKKIAVFTAIECKKTEKSRVTDEQQNFLNRIQIDGGFAGVAWDDETAKTITDESRFKPNQTELFNS